MQITLPEVVAFNTMKFLNSLPSKELVKVDGSDFKAITMKRKVVSAIKDANKPYADKLEVLDSLIKELQADIKAHADEIDAVEGSTDEVKKAEKDAYILTVNAKLSEDFKKVGNVLTLTSDAGTYLMVRTEDSVTFELEDRQVAFLKEQLVKTGVTAYDMEDDYMLAGAAFGLEE